MNLPVARCDSAMPEAGRRLMDLEEPSVSSLVGTSSCIRYRASRPALHSDPKQCSRSWDLATGSNKGTERLKASHPPRYAFSPAHGEC